MMSALPSSTDRAPIIASEEMAFSELLSWISRAMSRSIARRLAHTSTRLVSFWKPIIEEAVTKYTPTTTA